MSTIKEYPKSVQWEVLKAIAEKTAQRESKERRDERRRVNNMKSIGGSCPQLLELKHKLQS